VGLWNLKRPCFKEQNKEQPMENHLDDKIVAMPRTGVIGAEIQGVDLSGALDDGAIARISALLVEHKVLFFRDQKISRAQHIAFGRRFGELEIHPFTEGKKLFAAEESDPEIVIVESTAERQVSAEQWHSDVTWRKEPSLGSILRAIILPPVGGDTLWANMVAAYEGLSDSMQRLLSGLEATHDWHIFRTSLIAANVPEERIASMIEEYPKVDHPIVRTHPVSGEKLIYVNPVFVQGIKGMKDSESRSILAMLYDLPRRPEYQVRFRWEDNAIAFWDNRSTQHYAVGDFYPHHRRMERVTVAGDRPF
jgi:taurine dioxygenase